MTEVRHEVRRIHSPAPGADPAHRANRLTPSVWQRGQVHKYAPRDLILVPTLYPFLRVTTSIHESSGLFIRLSSLGGYRYLVERPRRPSGPDTPLARAAATFMRQSAVDLIARRYRDPALTPDVVADELHVSRRHLYRLFEGESKSPAMLITDARVEAARKMLDADHRVQIGDVAVASGFGSLATFRNQFKARHGVGPSEYRERRRE